MYLETEKCCILSGCFLDRYVSVVESGDANVTMLESSGTCEEVGWPQKCHFLPGATSSENGVDRANAGGGLHTTIIRHCSNGS
jgi:hypothetical protein